MNTPLELKALGAGLQVIAGFPPSRLVFKLWNDNTISIFRRVAPHDIKCLALARSLLADQCGASSESEALSPDDVRRIVRNVRKADKGADRFGREVAMKTAG